MGIRTGLCRHVRRALRTARYGTDVELLAGRTTVGRAEPGPPPAGRLQSGGVLDSGYSPLWCRRWDSNPHGALTPTVFEFPLEPSHPEPAIPESRCHVREFSSGSSWPTTSRELRQRPTWPHNGHSVGAGITASRQPEMQILLPRHEHRYEAAVVRKMVRQVVSGALVMMPVARRAHDQSSSSSCSHAGMSRAHAGPSRHRRPPLARRRRPDTEPPSRPASAGREDPVHAHHRANRL